MRRFPILAGLLLMLAALLPQPSFAQVAACPISNQLVSTKIGTTYSMR